METGPLTSAELARARDLAWAEALAGLSRVAATLSTRLHEMHRPAAPAAGATTELIDAATSAPPVRSGRIPHGGFGPRQRAVLALGGLDSAHGLSAGEVGRVLDIRQQNAHSTLTGLENLGQLMRIPGERPIRWRRARA